MVLMLHAGSGVVEGGWWLVRHNGSESRVAECLLG